MEKKIFMLVFVLMISLSIVSCGSSASSDNENDDAADTSATAVVTTNQGNTVKTTFDELVAAYDANEASFLKTYGYAKIEFTGTIKNIKVDTSVIVEPSSIKASQNKIVFEEGWCLVLSTNNTNFDLANFNAGDVVEVETSIVGAPYDTDSLQSTSDNERVLWLVGNDDFWFAFRNCQYSDIVTTIEKAS